jgi:glycosyltransferase involved in cell wall biosynthesis
VSVRVLMATRFPYDSDRPSGGVEAVALSLAPALAAHGRVELHIAAFSPMVTRSYDEVRGGIHFHWLAAAPRLAIVRALTIDALQLFQLVNRIRPDLLHAQAASALPIAALLSRQALVTTVHGLEMFSGRAARLRVFAGPVGRVRRMLSILLMEIGVRRSNAIIAISPYVEKLLGTRTPVPQSILIENPVATPFFGIPPESCTGLKVLLSVGFLSQLKDPIGTVLAFGKIARFYPEWRLVFVGDDLEPSYRQTLHRVLQSLERRDQVYLAGPASQSQTVDYYRQSAACVMGSLEEVAPLAITQAMAAGRPVVATRVGGVPWLVEPGVTGDLVPPGDVQAMAEALGRIVASPRQRSAMGERAHEQALSRFAPELVALRTVDFYHQVVDKVGCRA